MGLFEACVFVIVVDVFAYLDDFLLLDIYLASYSQSCLAISVEDQYKFYVLSVPATSASYSSY